MRRLLAAVLALGVWGGTSMLAGEQPVVLTFERSAAACKSFMGFGVEWDPGFWHGWNLKAGVTEADWELVTGRIARMKVPVMRVMMQAKWCLRAGGQYDWDSPEMKNARRYLDVCQRLGITVILTDWGCEPDWLKAPGIANVADPKYAEAIGTYLDHLLNAKGYTCIRYFVMVNEPNYEVKDWGRWKKGVENVAAELARRGLDRKMALAGPDESNDEGWHRNAVDQLQKTLGAYDVHRYAQPDEVRSGRLEAFFRTQWAYALEKDPQAGAKPLIVGEAGLCHPGFGAATNPRHLDFDYGVEMADYAAQAANAGSWAVSAWMLEDSSHQNFTWGMWQGKAGGFALKPWFYPWSLLCRQVPAGSTTYRPGKADPDLRALAARSEAKDAPGWTICLVNRGAKPRTAVIRTFEGGAVKLKHYLYAKDQAPADKDGFPVPVQERAGDLQAGVEVTCPANAVYLLTSIDRR